MNTLILPWPDARLLPNKINRLHWAISSSVRSSARQEGYYEVKAQLKSPYGLQTPVSVALEFTPPKRRGPIPDQDAMVSMMKAHLDGIADAIGIDDRHFDLEKPIVHKREGTGQVKVILS